MTSSKQTPREIAIKYLEKIYKTTSLKKKCDLADEWHFTRRTKNLQQAKGDIISKEPPLQ